MVNNTEIKYTKLFIDGEFVDGKLGKKFSTINPATEEEICKVSEATKEDVDLAVKAARRAFEEEWRSFAPYKRGELMNKWADLIERDIEIISKIECMDNGKPFNEVRNFDIPMVIRVIRYFAGWCDKICGKVIPVEGDYHVYTQREPVGVCGAIVPWNFPMYIASWKWSPCLAAGNTIILKSAEQTPLSVLYAAALAKEAGFPKGVFNVLSGYGETAGSAISHHMDIDKVSFTGSTEVGKLIQQASAKSNLKVC
jgi:acyl-CoA reductase-like NAD-dependent aldehyde dehydrogenase